MKMHAMLMQNSNEKLIYTQIEKPVPDPRQILIKVTACGLCRTDLHVVDDELKHPKLVLWGERMLCSVANLTRRDGEEFLSLAPTIPVKTEVHTYTLKEINEALDDLRYGRFTGSASQ